MYSRTEQVRHIYSQSAEGFLFFTISQITPLKSRSERRCFSPLYTYINYIIKYKSMI